MLRVKTKIAKTLDQLQGGAFCTAWNGIAFMQGRDRKITHANGFYWAQFGTHRVMYPENCMAKRGHRKAILNLGKTYFLDRIDFKANDRVVDCGANVGELGVYFKIKGTAVDYYAFEPAPREFQCLQTNNAIGRLFNNGLWHTTEKLRFYVKSDTMDSSILPLDEYERVVEIDAVRLDEVMPPGKIKLLKIEAEGAEPEALQGCAGVLPYTDYITVDAGAERGGKETLPQVVNYLLGQNFELLDVSHTRIVGLFRNKAATMNSGV